MTHDLIQPSDELIERALARRAPHSADPDLLRLISAAATQTPQARRWWPVGLPGIGEPARRLVWLAIVLMLMTFIIGAIVVGGLRLESSLVLTPTLSPPTPAVPMTAVWNATGSMRQGRVDDHTATLLPDGKVLVAGAPPVSAELYDPATGIWVVTGGMVEARGLHTATPLDDGRVLVAGGNLSGLASTELYDPKTGAWTTTGAMEAGRAGHIAVRLDDGRVLVAGGQDGSGAILASTELYDPKTGAWTITGHMAEARVVPTVTSLLDGRVLVTGGQDGAGDSLASAEIYDPATGSWTSTGDMHERRAYGTATRLPDDTVLVAGGGNPDHLASAELYDPITGSWSTIESMSVPRSQHVAALLRDGTVLVAGGGQGGSPSAELYDPATGTWIATGRMNEWRASPTATLLRDGSVLVAGGFGDTGDLPSAELFDLARREPIASPMPWSSRCDLGCQGPIAPGTFTSAGFSPGLQLTFADDTWFNVADFPGGFLFEQSSNVLRFLRDPGASSRTAELIEEVPRTPQGLTDWMVGNSDMVVSKPEAVTVGGGIVATTFTVQVSDTNVNVDPGCPRGIRSCLSLMWIGQGEDFAIGYGEAVRLYLFTIGSGTETRTIVALLDAPSASLLQDLTSDVAPILESIRLP